MKIFLSSAENSLAFKAVQRILDDPTRQSPKLLWNLISYYYCRTDSRRAEVLRDNSRLMLVDSGAHTFQSGTKVSWLEYAEQYAAFIRKFDRPNVVGYFELDVDKIAGMDCVNQMRRILESQSGVPDKIIPVWHDSRGVEAFTQMCKEREGKIVAISGFGGADIADSDYAIFLKEARKYNCKVHALGMTRSNILDRVPFDYVDSSTWIKDVIYGRLRMPDGRCRKVPRQASKGNRAVTVYTRSYLSWMELQKQYWRRWRKVSKDVF